MLVFVQVHESKVKHILVVNLVGSRSSQIQSLWIWPGSKNSGFGASLY